MKLSAICLSTVLLLTGFATEASAQGGPTPERVSAQKLEALKEKRARQATQRRMRAAWERDAVSLKSSAQSGASAKKGAAGAHQAGDIPVANKGNQGANKRMATQPTAQKKPRTQKNKRRLRLEAHLQKGGAYPGPTNNDKKSGDRDPSKRERWERGN